MTTLGLSRQSEAKWSLPAEQAQAAFSVKTGAPIPVHVGAYRWALENSTEFRPSDTFTSFVAVNRIEII
jgi:hypothetical protein